MSHVGEDFTMTSVEISEDTMSRLRTYHARCEKQQKFLKSEGISLQSAGGDRLCAMPETSDARPRYIMIGGFLGAGKTTAIQAFAEHLRWARVEGRADHE